LANTQSQWLRGSDEGGSVPIAAANGKDNAGNAVGEQMQMQMDVYRQ
jgi:hypothetical protein